MVAVRLAGREIMAAREPRKIARRDEAAPRDIFEVAGELRPERRLERDFLANRDDPEIGERSLRFGDAGIDLLGRYAADRHRPMMLAKARPARGAPLLALRTPRRGGPQSFPRPRQ